MSIFSARKGFFCDLMWSVSRTLFVLPAVPVLSRDLSKSLSSIPVRAASQLGFSLTMESNAFVSLKSVIKAAVSASESMAGAVS